MSQMFWPILRTEFDMAFRRDWWRLTEADRYYYDDKAKNSDVRRVLSVVKKAVDLARGTYWSSDTNIPALDQVLQMFEREWRRVRGLPTASARGFVPLKASVYLTGVAAALAPVKTICRVNHLSCFSLLNTMLTGDLHALIRFQNPS